MPKTKELSLEEIQVRNRPFYLIDKKEVLNGIRLSSENANSLYQAALKVKESISNNGASNSLLILAAEESIKAFVLLAVLVNVPFTFQIGEIFSKHTVKHARGEEINTVVNMVSMLLPLFSLKKTKRNNVFKEAIKSAVSIPYNEAWWKKANVDKNNGLYVDFRNDQFVSPLKFSETDFLTSETIVKKYVKLMDGISNIDDKDFAEIISLGEQK